MKKFMMKINGTSFGKVNGKLNKFENHYLNLGHLLVNIKEPSHTKR